MVEKSKKSPFYQYRSRTGMTPEEIARVLKVNRATIFRWESGETPVPISRLADIERVTGIPRQELRPDLVEALRGAA